MQNTVGIDYWAPVVGYEGWYEVSRGGSVRRVAKHAGHGGPTKSFGRPMNPRPSKSTGYVIAKLCKDGQQRGRAIHILVAEAFIGPRPRGHEVNHKDGDKANNALYNLEYVTSSQNSQHAYDTGLSDPMARSGERHGQSALTERMVRMIRCSYRPRFITFEWLSKVFGVGKRTVVDVVKRRTWKHVTP